MSTETPSPTPDRTDFIREIVAADLRDGRHTTIVTRFPPEPNGYLHIGHAKSICLNFGIADEFGGHCNLRFDDTNPVKEEQEYIDAIEADVRWLGFDWGEHLYLASDYFEQLYAWAVHLVRTGKAYVDDLSADEIREHRGTLTEPGRNSPWRDRPAEESLDLFERMRRASSRTAHACCAPGSTWPRRTSSCATPSCTGSCTPSTRAPATPGASTRRTTSRTASRTPSRASRTRSARWSSRTTGPCTTGSSSTCRCRRAPASTSSPGSTSPTPCSPSACCCAWSTRGTCAAGTTPGCPRSRGLRRRGFPAEGIREFAAMIGVAKADSVVEVGQLEYAVRGVLNRTAPRRFAVLNPLKVVIENYPEGQVEEMDVVNNPEDPAAGTRKVAFARELWIERDDFMEEPPPKFFRLAPGREVRLRCAYFVTCTSVVKDAAGDVVELRCTYDPATRGGDSPDGRRPKATLHWVSAAHAVPAEVRLFDYLFSRPDPRGGRAGPVRRPEPGLRDGGHGRVRGAVAGGRGRRRDGAVRAAGLLLRRTRTPRREHPVFNRTLTLKDTWAKVQAQGRQRS